MSEIAVSENKKPRKRPGRKERRRKRQETKSSIVEKDTLENRYIGFKTNTGHPSPIKRWLLEHSEDDEVPDEICDYITSVVSDSTTSVEDVVELVQQFLPEFSNATIKKKIKIYMEKGPGAQKTFF